MATRMPGSAWRSKCSMSLVGLVIGEGRTSRMCTCPRTACRASPADFRRFRRLLQTGRRAGAAQARAFWSSVTTELMSLKGLHILVCIGEQHGQPADRLGAPPGISSAPTSATRRVNDMLLTKRVDGSRETAVENGLLAVVAQRAVDLRKAGGGTLSS